MRGNINILFGVYCLLDLFCFKIGSPYVSQAGSKLLDSIYPISSASWEVGSTDMHHNTQLKNIYFSVVTQV
jgi:hypothetical protein